jgi:hypothetical protein
MDLFNTGLDENQNLLPKDGTVFVYNAVKKQFWPRELTGNHCLKTIYNIFCKLIITKRKVAWYGDTTLAYSKSNHKPLNLTPELLALKNHSGRKLEKLTILQKRC